MILVTGGSGLVGAHLLLDLAKSDDRVRAIRRKDSDLKAVLRVFSYEHTTEEADELFRRIEWMEADITDVPALEKAFEGIETVYHCAARVSFDSSENSRLRKTNIEGTANVVNLSIAHKIKKLCFVSSIATLDKKLGQHMLAEDSHWNQELYHSMYAITKYGAEMEVWRASQEGVPVVVVNPGVIIGPGFWKTGSGTMFPRIDKGLKFYFPKVTGFIGVTDVVKAMRLLMESSVENEQFVLVSENLSFKAVLEQVARSIDRPVPSKRIRPWMIFMGWMYQKSFGFFFSGERQLTRCSAKDLFNKTFYSSERIKSQLDFSFETMETVISRTGKAYLKDTSKK